MIDTCNTCRYWSSTIAQQLGEDVIEARCINPSSCNAFEFVGGEDDCPDHENGNPLDEDFAGLDKLAAEDLVGYLEKTSKNAEGALARLKNLPPFAAKHAAMGVLLATVQALSIAVKVYKKEPENA